MTPQDHKKKIIDEKVDAAKQYIESNNFTQINISAIKYKMKKKKIYGTKSIKK